MESHRASPAGVAWRAGTQRQTVQIAVLLSSFRYITHIDTSHPKEEWSYSDEQRMFDLHNELGNKWAIIGSKLDGRYVLSLFSSDNCVKNHFYSKLRKALRKINRVVQTNYKKELKEFKPNILYRIVEVSEENFKTAPSY